MVVGTVVSALILPGPLTIVSSIVLDVHTLLFCTAAVIIGFQGVAFAFCARVYALHEGLLPGDPLLERLLDRFTLETGLVVGAILLAAGFGGALYSLARWSATGFGPLDPRVMLRAAIPAAAAMCLGGEVVLTSFFLSFLGLRRLGSPSAS